VRQTKMALQRLMFGARSALQRSPLRAATSFRMFSSNGQDIDAEDEALIEAYKAHVEPEHRPPIKIRGVPAKYANAAYINASRENTLDNVEADLKKCRDLASKEAVLFLKNPAVTQEQKFELLDGALKEKEVGSAATERMLKKLIEDRKFAILDDVVENFEKLMRAKRGELIAIVTSAEKLTKGESNKLKKSLEAQFEDKTVLITNQVDATILGGLMIDIDDKFADLSVRTALFDEHFRRSNARA